MKRPEYPCIFCGEKDEDGAGHASDCDRNAVHDAVIALSPWTNHRAACARVTSAGACDCGLQAVLESFPREM